MMGETNGNVPGNMSGTWEDCPNVQEWVGWNGRIN